jgi:hypothetical protein
MDTSKAKLENLSLRLNESKRQEALTYGKLQTEILVNRRLHGELTIFRKSLELEEVTVSQAKSSDYAHGWNDCLKKTIVLMQEVNLVQTEKG